MTRQEFQELAELYALGLLDTQEKAACEDYIAAQPQESQHILRSALALNSRILGAGPELAPPRRLRARVISALTAKPGRSVWQWAWVAVAAALVVVTIWMERRDSATRAELAGVRRLLEQQSSDARRSAEVLAMVGAPGTRAISPPQGQASYFLNPSRGVVLIVGGLERLPSGRAYEMWIIPKGRAPAPAGMFTPDAQGNAIHTFPGQVDLSDTAALAISDEPHGGSPAPTTAPRLIASVPGG